MATRPARGWQILATLLAALVLELVPLGPALEPWWPPWLTLTLVYWCMQAPGFVGIGVGFSLGLLQDVLRGSLLGQQALAYTIVAYVVLRLYPQVRFMPRVYQVMFVGALLLSSELLVIVIAGASTTGTATWRHLLPVLSGTLLWTLLLVARRERIGAAGRD